eukprot:3003878-Amphidinium_carterae.1
MEKLSKGWAQTTTRPTTRKMLGQAWKPWEWAVASLVLEQTTQKTDPSKRLQVWDFDAWPPTQRHSTVLRFLLVRCNFHPMTTTIFDFYVLVLNCFLLHDCANLYISSFSLHYEVIALTD